MADARYIADLHPDGLIQESRRLITAAIERIATMPNAQSRAMRCPICESSDLEVFARRGRWTIDRCRACDFRFTNPPPTTDQLRAFYESPAKIAENAIFEATRTARLDIFRTRADLVLRHARGGTLLEIGGATGLFVEALQARPHPFDVTVVELSTDACARLRRRFPDLHVINGDALEHHDRYDHVCLWETLPYIGSATAALAHIARLLRPGGYLFLNAPNTRSLEHIAAGADHPQVQPLPAVSYFSAANLRLLLERSGFEVVETSTPNAHFDVRFVRQQKDDPAIRAGIGGFLAEMLDDEAFASDFAALLRNHCLGGNVTVAARLNGTAKAS